MKYVSKWRHFWKCEGCQQVMPHGNYLLCEECRRTIPDWRCQTCGRPMSSGQFLDCWKCQKMLDETLAAQIMRHDKFNPPATDKPLGRMWTPGELPIIRIPLVQSLKPTWTRAFEPPFPQHAVVVATIATARASGLDAIVLFETNSENFDETVWAQELVRTLERVDFPMPFVPTTAPGTTLRRIGPSLWEECQPVTDVDTLTQAVVERLDRIAYW